MKSNAPWSVKGIEKDVRETAKEAARREGMTVGEWLNTVIVQAGDPETSSTGEITGLALRDLATAIEHLSGRVASAESRSQEAIDDLSRTFGGVVERVQRLERSRHDGTDAGAIADRVEKLEAKTNDRQRIETLKALERAVGQMALQFDTAHKTSIARLDSNERQMQELASRIQKLSESGVGDGGDAVSFLKDAIDGMSARIGRAERIANEAAKLKSESAGEVDSEFVERTGQRLRVLGDEIKRGGDQMRSLEQAITRLSGQIDAAERRSSEGVEKVSETIAELREQLLHGDDAASGRADIEQAVADLTQRTEDRIAALQNSFEEMLNQLEAAGAAPEEDDEDVAAERAPGASALADISFDADESDERESADTTPEAAEKDDLQSELDAAFADLDLGEVDDASDHAPSKTKTAALATPAVAATSEPALPEPELSDPALSDDDFDFDFDEPTNNAADDHDEAADVIADVNAAFGVGETSGKSAGAQTSDADDFDDVMAALDRYKDDTDDDASVDDVDDVDAPPMALEEPAGPFGRKSKPVPPDDAPAIDAEPTSASDYLKAARAAAREEAAKAALETDDSEKKRKLTPKQRAILAARIKRKREEAAARAAAETEAKNPPSAPEPEIEEEAPKASPFDKIKALLKARSGKPAKDIGDLEADDAAINEGDFTRRASPLDPRKATKKKARSFAPKPTVIAIGAGVVLAGAAAYLTLRDNGASEQRPVTSARGAAPAADTLSDGAVQPRDLYFDAMQALATTTTDGGIRAAIRELEQSAALGHPPAQLQLGEMYKSGDSVTKDLDQARVWYERAAAGGNVLAMHRLGVMAARGEGGPVEPARSIEWFEQAATLGLVDAQFNLGTTYHPSADGATVFQDREKAFYWYSLAAKNGDSQAGELAAGVGAALAPEKRAELLAEVDLWEPLPVNDEANERAAV